MLTVVATPILPHQVAQALPLLQPLTSALDLARWEDFTRLLLDGSTDRGVDVVCDQRGYLVGLVTYRIVQDLRCGTVLRADQIVASDLIRVRRAVGALVQALELRAR